MKEPKLLVNAMITPDGTFLDSRHRHDYKTHFDSVTKCEYTVDGGLDYVRRSTHPPEFAPKSIVLYSNSDHEDLREYFTWGTHGINGDQPKKLVKLKHLDKEHIEAILETQTQISDAVYQLLLNELLWRETKE